MKFLAKVQELETAWCVHSGGLEGTWGGGVEAWLGKGLALSPLP